MTPIFHITSRAEYDAAVKSGSYTPKRFEQDGFIHCSYMSQIVGVADVLFRGETDLLLLEIDRDRVGAEVVDEDLSGGDDLYPHIYGALPITAVVSVHAFPSKEDGTFDLPSTVNGKRRIYPMPN